MNQPIQMKDLPSPKGKFLSGNFKEFKSDAQHLILQKWVDEIGDLFQINLFGKKFIVSADLNINDTILRSRPNDFRRYHKIDEIMREMGISGVFNAEGEEWKTHRKIAAEALNRRNVEGFFPSFKLVTERLLDVWNGKAEESERIDVMADLMRYTVDVTTLLAFSYDTNTLQKEGDVIQGHLNQIFPMITKRTTAPIPLWRYFKSEADKQLVQSLSVIEGTINEYIDKAKKRRAEQPNDRPQDFLEALLIESEKVGAFTDKEVFGNVFTMLLAGEDTTSNTMAWILYFIATNPEVHQKVREEAGVVFGDQTMVRQYDDLLGLKYTEAVIMEALRYKPVTPSLFMEAKHDVVVEGLEVKKGMTVMLLNKAPQNRDEYFTDAKQFKPERWLKGGCPHHTAHDQNAMKVFGGGARFCPGRALAIDEMKIALSMICKNFDLELDVPKESVKEAFNFTMYPDNLYVKLKKI